MLIHMKGEWSSSEHFWCPKCQGTLALNLKGSATIPCSRCEDLWVVFTKPKWWHRFGIRVRNPIVIYPKHQPHILPPNS